MSIEVIQFPGHIALIERPWYDHYLTIVLSRDTAAIIKVSLRWVDAVYFKF